MKLDKKLLEKYVRLMSNETKNRDLEVAHANARGLLCDLLYELGYDEVVYEFNKIDERYFGKT